MNLIFSWRQHDHYYNRALYIIYWRLIFHCKGNKTVELCSLRGLLLICTFLQRQIWIQILNGAMLRIGQFYGSQPRKFLTLIFIYQPVYLSIHPGDGALVLSGLQNMTEYLASLHTGAISLWALHQQSGVNLANVAAIGELPTSKQTRT